MTDFDDMIKNYAKTERVQAPVGFEARIDKTAERISKSDIKFVFSTKILRPPFAVAVITTCILLIGGIVYASGILSRLDVSWDGKAVREYYQEGPQIFTKAEGYIEESADEYAFRNERNDGEIRRIGNIDVIGNFFVTFESGLRSTLNTLDELKEQIDSSQDTRLKLPSYIPAGYELESVHAGYYLSADYIDLNMPPDSVSISENGNQMQTFKLPETYKNHVILYQLTYINACGSRIDIVGSYEADTTESTFDVSPDSIVGHPIISGFQKSIYYSDSYTEGDTKFINSVLAVLQETKALDVYLASDLDFSKSGTNPTSIAYNSIRYQIYVTNDSVIGADELVSIVSSLK